MVIVVAARGNRDYRGCSRRLTRRNDGSVMAPSAGGSLPSLRGLGAEYYDYWVGEGAIADFEGEGVAG